MKASLPLEKTNAFSTAFLDYVNNASDLRPFYGERPTLEGMAKVMENYSSVDRETLVNTLEEQYLGVGMYDAVKDNLEALRSENTFTVTTGHQLNIFGGPLFFIYKLVTVIKLAKELEASTGKKIVPVYWMASEDHDYEEINHFRLFNKKYEWNTLQTGAVGRFFTENFEEIFERLPEEIKLFEDAYLRGRTLAEATRCFVNTLFGDHGLVILDADDRALKANFASIMEEEMMSGSSEKLVLDASSKLEKLGYKPQIHPRPINLFYMEDGLRGRIVREGETFGVLNNGPSFSKEQLLTKLEASPEAFSPNVVLRPVYQQKILPNLAYVGGPAEIVYWLQLKDVFDHFKVDFPALVPRNFALVIPKPQAKKMDKLELSVEDLFLDEEMLKKQFVDKHSEYDLGLDDENKALEEVFEAILEKVKLVDGSMEGYLKGEQKKAFAQLKNIERRLKKAEEKKQETEVGQLLNLKSRLFPNGGLQERVDNFLNFYLNDEGFIDTLFEAFDPLDFKMVVLK